MNRSQPVGTETVDSNPKRRVFQRYGGDPTLSSGTVQKTRLRQDLLDWTTMNCTMGAMGWQFDNQVTVAPVGCDGPREAKQSPLLLDVWIQGRVAM